MDEIMIESQPINYFREQIYRNGRFYQHFWINVIVFVAIIGGAKVSTKLEVCRQLLGKVDTLIIGGGMVFTFLKAKGLEIGKSLLEENMLDVARRFLENAKTSSTEVRERGLTVTALTFLHKAK